MTTETTAQRLGTTAHISPLLMKARGLGLNLPLDLDRLAVLRGCDYYRPNTPEPAPPPIAREQFSDEELITALLSGSLPHSPRCIRLAAALSGREGLHIDRLVLLAVRERCVPALRYIAHCGADVEPRNAVWQELLAKLPTQPEPKVDALPHPTRFCTMTGLTRDRIGVVRQWIRPSRSSAS